MSDRRRRPLISSDDVLRVLQEGQTDDVRFLVARVAKDCPEGRLTAKAFHAAILDLLEREDIALNHASRILIRYALGRAWYPREFKRQERASEVERDRFAIKELAARLKSEAQGKRGAWTTLAEREVARVQNISVNGLRRRRYRKRKKT
jgi:hypothetical protein